MPPAGTKLPTNRVRKPPSCDTCKQKRVLCHPSPTGCPRCVEKGLVCTTTPVVRRKPTKRKKFENESTAAPETASPSGSPRASTVDPIELPIPPTTSSHLDQSIQSNIYDPTTFNPIASTSSFVHDPIPTASSHPQDPVFIPNFDSFQLVSLNHAPTRLSVSPDLAQHLFRVFRQTPQHQHPLFVTYTLDRTLKTLNWQVDLLPSHSHVLAYCIFAVASLLSHHTSILDPFCVNFGGACPSNFDEVLKHLPDLRKFGKLRLEACQMYRQEAIRRAKESDILFVASEEAATACHLLYWLESIECEGRYSSSSVWYAAGMSHLRVLHRTSSLGYEEMQARWVCYMLLDCVQALFEGQVPPSYSDQLLLVGPTKFSEEHVERETERSRSDESKGWPYATPHLILSLELARRVHDEIAGAWTRDVPFDFARTSSILDSLESRRRVGTTFVQYIDKYIDTIQPPVPLQHFPSNLGNDPTERIKSSEITAMRSYRMVIQIGWTYLTLLVYQELKKRQRNWKASDQTNERYVKSKLDFCVKEARQLAKHGLEAEADAFENMSALAIWTHSHRRSLQKWAEFLVSEVHEGLIVLDGKVVGLMETLSRALKQAGYVWSNSTLDSLILSLDSHAVAYRLASNNPSPPTSTSYPITSQFAQSTDSFDFDPSVSLFANLTAISTPSGSSNDYSPVENVGRPTSSQTGCAPDRESGAKNGLDELSQVLGLY